MRRINIMTSCDDTLAEYVLPQIASIGVNLSNYQVEFFLFHYRISSEKIGLIREYSKSFKNLSFNEIVIEDLEPYIKLMQFSGKWPHEAYFNLCCHTHLPQDVERILYIDAADVIIDGDIAEYYFGDFEGCSIIGTTLRFTNDLGEYRIFNREDMSDPMRLRDIKSGVFNSGSFVINVVKLREDNLTMNDFIYVATVLRKHRLLEEMHAYLGDQGLLSIAFVGDIKFFAYPEIKNVYYMPYNFCTYFFDARSELWYTPIILHYAGHSFKPWKARFSVEEVDKYKFKTDFTGDRAPFYLKGTQIEFFEIWWRYCEMTPIYEKLNHDASIRARTLEAHFLPLCKKYNDLIDSK